MVFKRAEDITTPPMGFNSGSAPQTHFIVCEVKRSKVNCFKMRIKAKVTLECAGIFFGISLLSLFLAYSWTGPHISWNKLTAGWRIGLDLHLTFKKKFIVS